MPNSTMLSTQEAISAGREAEELSQVVLGSLEEDASVELQARRAWRTRAQFFRVFDALIEEAPAAAPPAARARRPAAGGGRGG